MSDKGQKVVGDPSLENIDPSDIILESIGKERPPQGQDGKPILTNQGIMNQDPILDNMGQQNLAPPDLEKTNGLPPVNPANTMPPDPNPNTAPLVSQEKQEAPTVDPNAQTPTADPNAAAPPASPPVQQQIDPWNEVFSSLKNESGIEFQNKDQFVNELKQFNQYKQDPLGFLEPEIKAHAEFIKAGGDTQEFYRLKSVDFKALPDKEILFQSHLRDHPDHAKDPDFARMYFEKQFGAQYSILNGAQKTPDAFINDESGEQDPIAYQDYLNERTFAEKSLVFDSNSKREKLVAWQEQSTSPPSQPGTGMSVEETKVWRDQYMSAVDKVKTSYVGEEIPISEKPEENLKIGLNEKIKPLWEKDLTDPMAFFNELGLQNDGKLDLEKLSRASFIFRSFKNLGPIATKLILENQARETVEGRQINAPVVKGTNEPGAAQGDDELAEVADLILQKDFAGRPPS